VAMIGRYRHMDERGRPDGAAIPYSYTGCILENRGNWFIGTSSHVLGSLRAAASDPRVRVESKYLADQFGYGSKSDLVFPFDPLEAQSLALPEKYGLDLGLIHLRPHYRELLAANGIIPFTPRQWCFPNDLEFESFGVVGFPHEFTSPDVDDLAPGAFVVQPVFVPLRKVEDDLSMPVRRFRGEIVGMQDQKSLVGMSGGPIVGFYRDNGQSQYLLQAIQSSWNEQDTAYGCYLRDAAEVIHRAALVQAKRKHRTTDTGLTRS